MVDMIDIFLFMSLKKGSITCTPDPRVQRYQNLHSSVLRLATVASLYYGSSLPVVEGSWITSPQDINYGTSTGIDM